MLGGDTTFKARYDHLSDEILVNKQRYSQNASLIEDAGGQLNEYGPPQHAWDQVAPGTEEQQASDRAEGVVEQEDLDANAQMFRQQQHSSTVLQRYTSEVNRRLLSPVEYQAETCD